LHLLICDSRAHAFIYNASFCRGCEIGYFLAGSATGLAFGYFLAESTASRQNGGKVAESAKPVVMRVIRI
jgi:hypothetical protein